MTGPRNKYLAAEQEQERLDKLQNFQLDQMRKTVLHLSAAAKGLDETLDKELSLLKEKIRGASGSQVVDQMERVHLAVNAFERNRDNLNQQAVGQYSLLVKQLLELKLPAEVKKKLESYGKNLKDRLDSWRVYPNLIAELAVIQKLALEAAMQPDEGFWQRIKGGKKLTSEDNKKTEATEEKKKTRQAPKSSESPTGEIEEIDSKQVSASTIPPEPVRQNFETPDAEETYELVAKRITRTLTGLIENIEINDLIKHKVDIVQSRLNRGLDWYALAVTLEDIRDILMQRYLSADKEFSDYLKKVNEDLNGIREKLGLAVATEGQQQGAIDVFSEAVSLHVDNMRTSLNKGGDLNHLKQEIVVHIDEIYQALETFKKSEEHKESLSDQLRSLVERVHSIESESQKTKVLLEEERYKATHDPLTQLPNREAYAERAWQEQQRFKRYGRDLSLAVCDIDHFKKINDNYGHQAGDKVLKLFAKLLSSRLREVDFVGRYGGEEFVILMPETSAENARKVLDKIRASISKTPFRFHNEPVQITVSFGISSFNEDDQIETVFSRADKALYDAKNQGRNRCIVA